MVAMSVWAVLSAVRKRADVRAFRWARIIGSKHNYKRTKVFKPLHLCSSNSLELFGACGT